RPHPVISGRKIDLEYLVDMTIEECEWAFRFTQHELQCVVNTLEITDPFRTQDGHWFTIIEAFALLCAQFHMPKDQFSLSTKYTCSQTTISQVINKLSCWADKTWGHLLDWDDKGIMHPNHLCGYTLALDDFSVPSSSLVALIDCTIQATCQPSIDQELAYMDYKKCHGFKFQTLVI
ncbi:hypothetical protein M422DRAFT_106792, partial [Sphaerobolus stellatus SS14]